MQKYFQSYKIYGITRLIIQITEKVASDNSGHFQASKMSLMIM